MYDFFEYSGRQKGYKSLPLGNSIEKVREIIKANEGKRVFYLIKRDYDSRRGIFYPRKGILSGEMDGNLIIFSSGYHNEIEYENVLDFAAEEENNA